MPQKIQFRNGNKSEYNYDASGVKYKAKWGYAVSTQNIPLGSTNEENHSLTGITYTEYCGNYIYENGILTKILNPEGYISTHATDPIRFVNYWKFNFLLKDHLANTRRVLTSNNLNNSSTTLNNDSYGIDYYPFGMEVTQSASSPFLAGTVTPYLYNGKEIDRMHGLDMYDYGKRFYGPDGSRFFTIDPKAEQFPWQSPYAYAANNPIKFIDKNGENPAIPIAVGVAAVDALLIATGIVATGIILHKAADGSFAINSNITSYFYKDNPGYREQQKREGASQRETSQIKQNHAKSVDNNVGKPTPDGGSTPKGGGSTVAKVVAGAGFAAEFVRACNETTRGNNQNSSGEKQSSGNSVTTISQGTTTSESTSNTTTNSTFTMPVYTTPSDNTRVVTPIIPLRIDEKN